MLETKRETDTETEKGNHMSDGKREDEHIDGVSARLWQPNAQSEPAKLSLNIGSPIRLGALIRRVWVQRPHPVDSAGLWKSPGEVWVGMN